MRFFAGNKPYLIPFTIAIASFVAIFGVIAHANNDILVLGQLWKTGLAGWQDSISIEPGQEFKITSFGGNYSTQGTAVSNVAMVDGLPQYTSYVAGSAFQILDNSGNWVALADDGTTPFDGAGLSVTADGALSALEFANYKYSVKADNFLPTNTTQLSWGGPVLHFTDASGAQTKGNIHSTSINIANLPAISSFSLNANTYKLGDVITATATGDAGKSAHIEIGSISFNLGGSGSNYTGAYTVQAGDSITATPRVFFDNGSGTGSYRDAPASVTIDGVVPPAPSNLGASVDSGTLVATVIWTAASPEADLSQYNIYSNGGSGLVNYTTPIATVLAGTTQYVTSPLASDSLYAFAVRSQDAAGNIEQNTNIANAATDFTPPDAPVSLVQPTTLNDTVFRFGLSNPLVFVWAPTLSADVARYRVEIDDNSDFSSIIASLETTAAGTSLTATSTQVSLPDGIYSWRVRAIDDAENVSNPTVTPDNTFEIDTANPGSVVYASPALGSHIAGNFTATGTAADSGSHMAVSGSTTGIEKVEVFLQNFMANPKEYWNGTAWTTTQAWLAAGSADNFANWSYNVTATITDGTAYFTGARVTDRAGNTLDSALVGLTGNTSTPNVNITAPVNGSYQASGVVVAGTASDPGGTTISDVSVSIQRSSDSLYWNGAAWVGAIAWNTAGTANNFANWTYSFNPDFSATPEGTVYTITARAIDGVFGTPNMGTSAARTTVKDTTAPIVAITSPLAANSPFNAISWDAANPIAGTASDALSGVSGVQVAIQDSSGNYWNAADWTSATAVWLNAASSDSFATWKYVNAGADFIPNKDDDFTIYARGTDNAIGTPNTSAPVSQAVTYDTVAPVVANAVATNSTVSNITTLIKNGDVFILSADVTDALGQTDMTIASITADISAITGNGGDTAVVPASYNTATSAAVWNFAAAAGTGNGNLSVSITATDPAGNAVLFTNNAIIVADNTAPAITAATLTVPSAAGIAWAGGSGQNITWTSAAITDLNLAANPVTLEYSTDGFAWNPIAANEANDGSFSWTIPSINSNTATVRITATDQVANTSNDVSDNQFTIDSTPPTVPATTLISPNGGEAWKQGTVRTITWNSAGITDNFGLAANPITLSFSASSSSPITCTSGPPPNACSGGGGGGGFSIGAGEANDGSFGWTIPSQDHFNARITITVTDAAGNTATDQSDNTFVVGLPPTIAEVRAVSNTTIEVEWNRPISNAGAFANYTATGITPTAVAINGTDDTIVELTVNALGDTGFMALDFAVAADTVTDVLNFKNEAVAGASIIDRQSPQITAHKLMSLIGDDYMVINFSENIATTSAQTLGNYSVESPTATGLNISGSTLIYANNKIIAQLANAINLNRTNSYQITLNNISDLAGNNVVANTQINGTVTGALTLSEIISDPQLDWSSTNFTATPTIPTNGLPGDIGDRFIELYIQESGLDLRNWTMQISRIVPPSGPPLTIQGSFVNGSTIAPIFSVRNYNGSGNEANTGLGSTMVLADGNFATIFEDPSYTVLSAQIIVKDDNGIIIDQVTIGAFNDGNTGDNAPPVTSIPGDPVSIHQEGITRDHNLTDTNNDAADWHVTRATPGVIDVTAPAFNMANTYPGQNQLIVDTAPRLVIPLTETESGIRWSTQVTLKIDGVTQTVSMDLANHIIFNIPGAALAYGKHTVTVDVADNANNIAPTQTWDFWIDNFTGAMSLTPMDFRFNGNTFEYSTPAEQQSITVSTYGAGYKIYALFAAAITDGFGNFIRDIGTKLAADPWTNSIDLNSATQVQLVSVAKAATPNLAPTVTTYTYDYVAQLTSIAQAAGNYNGTLQFIVVPEY